MPYDELPRVVNPEEGFIATANNEVIDDSYPYHITKMWAQPYRYERIAEVLRERDDFTPEDMMQLQMDQKNMYAGEFLNDLLGSIEAQDEGEKYKEVVSMLREWDQLDSVDAAAPLVFHKLMKQLPIVMFSEEMPEDVYKLLPGKGSITDQLLRAAYAGEPGAWIEQYGGVDKWVFDSFEQSVGDIEEQFGKKVASWKWGDFHQVEFPHALSGASPIFEYFLNPKKQAIGGSNVTVQAAAFQEDGTVDHGAPWRFVADLSDLSTAYHILGPGQSGHMKSQWFHNQVDDWVQGNYRETVLDGDIKESSTLLLKAER